MTHVVVQSMEGKFTIGADPELFLRKKNKWVAVQPYVTGTKDTPQPLPLGGNAQRDNVAIEFGILPAETLAGFVENIQYTLSDLKDILPKDIEMVPIASANFPKRELKHKECKLFGCDPDFNAWTMQVNEPPKDAAKNTFRSCGGHIHVGYVNGSKNDFLNDLDGKAMLIRVMDCVLGIAATILDNSKESIDRRKLYGKAGCYRPTDYGVEYRTLSNFWIKSPILVGLIYKLTEECLKIMRDGNAFALIEALGGPLEIQRVISEGDAESAEEMWEIVMKGLSQGAKTFWNKVSQEDILTFEQEWHNFEV